MIILLLLAAIIVGCFAAVMLVGAPYLPTLGSHIEPALDLTELKPGDTLLELGSGDGRVVLAAALRGFTVVGYELNPILVLVSRLRTWRYRRQVHIIWGNFWQSELPPAQAIFVFLLPKYMEKLDKKFIQYKHKPVKIVSFAFAIPEREPAAEADGIFCYEYR